MDGRGGSPLATSWADERVIVAASALGGRGTFAQEPIAAGESVFRWGGTLFSVAEIRLSRAKPGTVSAIAEAVYLAAPRDAPDHAVDFTNHSCDPNLWLVDAVTLVARRDIAGGEELTGDYAMWEADETYVAAWPCRCGAPCCRGRLTGQDWRRADLQARYRGHFSPFLNRRIAALAMADEAP